MRVLIGSSPDGRNAAVQPIVAPQVGQNGLTVVDPTAWSVYSFPAAATQATVTMPAGGTGVVHVCTSITVSLALGSTAQTPIQAVLRDGISASARILWTAGFSSVAYGCAGCCENRFAFRGSPNTPMTLEFAAAGVAGSQLAVTLGGFSTLTV